MPTVMRHGPYRFFFYSGDRDEPAHVHVERDQKSAKFGLNPVRFQASKDFSPPELRRIRKIIEEQEVELIRRWDDYFNA